MIDINESSAGEEGAESDVFELTRRNFLNWSTTANHFIEFFPEPSCLLDNEGLICHANSAFFSAIGPSEFRFLD